VSVITRLRISDIKPIFTNLAQTSHYQINFSGLSSQLSTYLLSKGIDSRFVAEEAGILCNSASLPGSSFATADISGNFTGVNEKMAHTRMFSQTTVDFYVDSQYKSLKFIEYWMEFISSGSGVDNRRKGYFFRMQYPTYYKSDSTKIIKFDRDYKNILEYTFYGLFPIALDAVNVSYQGSEVLKATVTFNYERYVCGLPSFNLNFPSLNFNLADNTNSGPRLIPIRGQSGVVFYDSNRDTRTTAEVNRRFFDSQGRPIIN
jgi:hypothetical protein